ncbi:uracil-DNA glycosylase family protein [Priestia aryabhattai]|uniref:uracil-DNA glycosylase family protein n=1 Tax=Priestia aryabhattai TaxID=412384 RepID=UPI0039A12FF4
MISQHSYFQQCLPAIQQLHIHTNFTKEQLLQKDFLIRQENELSMYYSPHNDYINPDAHIVIAGITPGWFQMKTAFKQCTSSLSHHHSLEEVLYETKKAASFSGTMRANLIAMLDRCGIQKAAGINSAAELFASQRHLLHTTSVLKYPVFYKRKNYTGHQPPIERSALLSHYAFEVFLHELNEIKNPCLIVPLGKAVEQVLRKLSREPSLSRHTYLFGFPHPSGANGHRKRIFEEHLNEFTEIVEKWAAKRKS